MVSRIDSVQAARDHSSRRVATGLRCRGIVIENAERSGDSNDGECLASSHDFLLHELPTILVVVRVSASLAGAFPTENVSISVSYSQRRLEIEKRQCLQRSIPPPMRDQQAALVWWHRGQSTALVNGLKGSTIYEIVAMAAFTGMRPISTWRSRN